MAAEVVLASKVYVAGDARERTLRGLRGLIEDRVGGLDAAFEVDVREDDFPVVTLEGDDARVAASLLAEEFGAIPDGFEPGESYVGTLEHWDDEGFVLDAGTDVRIPASGLGLGPGSPQQIVERFGLVQHLPMRFVYGGESDAGGGGGDAARDDGDRADGASDGTGDGASGDAGEPAARLADAERDRLYDWQRGPGRVNVNSATRSEVRATVNRAGHARDVVTVERLGLLEQSVICEAGTDPPGLIASVGEYLPAELRAVV